jgi:aryl-alcohol dehydrogenase-like predicted oxidoreductase
MGTMTFGEAADAATSKQLYATCRDHGINFFDCANGYAKGRSEELLGKFIRSERDQVVITSKVYFPTGNDINARGLSRFHMTKAIDDSLTRLGTDYIDIYYLHHFDEGPSLQDTMMTMNDFVRQGKVLYVGLSNFAAWQVVKAISLTEQMHLAPVSCIQPMYNLLKRQAESEIFPMALSEQLGVFTYSPLAGGLLTGKYLKKKSETSRFDTSKMYQKRYEAETNKEIVNAFMEFAIQHNYNPVSLAIAWVGAHPAVTAPIIGARNMDQLKPTLDALKIDMDQTLWDSLNDLTLAPALATDREEERG